MGSARTRRAVRRTRRDVVDRVEQDVVAVHEEDGSEDGRGIRVGFLADPGLPAKMAERMADKLADVLSEQVDDTVRWRVGVRVEPLALDGRDDIPLNSIARTVLAEEDWEYVVALTDLPRRVGIQPLLFSLNKTHRSAMLSLPATGWIRMRAHVWQAVVHLVDRLTAEDPRRGRARRPESARPGHRITEFVSPVRAVGPEYDMDEHLVLVGLRGRARLLLGMVRSNRPWRLVPSLSSAFAAAAATGSFGVFYNSMWSIADALSPLRLALISVFAMSAMTVWLIVYNGLWESPKERREREEAVLYNVSTVCTVGIGVACVYALLLGVTLTEALVVIDGSVMEAALGHPPGLASYVSIAWLASSLGTMAGALGSSFEDQAAVREAAYSARERERRARFDESAEKDGEARGGTSG
ncbi:hypothetical protein A6A08_08835 [Nocardiopsis sp. TSRI0078]|uniref:hypothetical protein n=1 Tax=unclassified Nocardiopsis TaxID=2649073 RepID=UPI000963C27D|nr:hypothetical protein [Nocardiopsis sp. TSRI0078]OKI15671.1 hypothetical protein A6A08_08835 [Nocardiopsis sp. TSRI0078]